MVTLEVKHVPGVEISQQRDLYGCMRIYGNASLVLSRSALQDGMNYIIDAAVFKLTGSYSDNVV